MEGKKMYKVLCPMTGADGGTYWKDLGRGFDNRDNSINMKLDVLPLPGKDGRVHIQLREMTEQDIRERAERRQSYAARASHSTGSIGGNGSNAGNGGHGLGGSAGRPLNPNDVPF